MFFFTLNKKYVILKTIAAQLDLLLPHDVRRTKYVSEMENRMKIKGEYGFLKKIYASQHPHLVMLAVTYLIGVSVSIIFMMQDYFESYYGPGEPMLPDLLTILLLGGCFSIFFVLPVFLLQANLLALLQIPKSEKWRKVFRAWEHLSVVMSAFMLLLSVGLSNIAFEADWQETLYNSQLHSPIWPEAYPVIIVMGCVAVLGYLILSAVPLRKLPPLVTVLSIAAMYLGVVLCILWDVQTLGNQSLNSLNRIIFAGVTLNLILVVWKTIRYKIAEWNEKEQEEPEPERSGWYGWLNQWLSRSANWPLAAFLFMIPLFGILIAILTLFGQRPDAFLKAWTETSDWQLSERISPPNVEIDEHYLCTVAAGGHRKIVKPLRMGERHGHRVVVNRQLCIANAFEQILEQRTPKFHRLVRRLYDTCGFPVAKLIRSRWEADIVYVLMKPLEWMFLIVIYLCDVKPENRIAVQYLPRK